MEKNSFFSGPIDSLNNGNQISKYRGLAPFWPGFEKNPNQNLFGPKKLASRVFHTNFTSLFELEFDSCTSKPRNQLKSIKGHELKKFASIINEHRSNKMY